MISTNIIKGAMMTHTPSDCYVRIELVFNVAMGMIGVYDGCYRSEPSIWLNMAKEDYELIYELDDHFDYLKEGEAGRMFEEIKEWATPWL